MNSRPICVNQINSKSHWREGVANQSALTTAVNIIIGLTNSIRALRAKHNVTIELIWLISVLAGFNGSNIGRDVDER